MDKREPWYTVGRNVNWYGQYGICRFLKKLKIELPYNPALAVLFFCQKKILQRYLHPHVCCRIYLQKPRHGNNLSPSGVNGERSCGIHIQWNITQAEKEGNPAFYDNMNGPEGIMLSKISQTEGRGMDGGGRGDRGDK